MKQIELSGERGHGKYALVDDEDFEILRQYKWNITAKGYAKRRGRVSEERATVAMHQTVLEGLLGRPLLASEFPEHANGNPLDNTRSNLRLANAAENARNRKLQANSSTGYIGVFRRTDSGRYMAHIMIDGKKKSLGTFATPQEAAVVRDRAARKHFGEFARLNFP